MRVVTFILNCETIALDVSFLNLRKLRALPYRKYIFGVDECVILSHQISWNLPCSFWHVCARKFRRNSFRRSGVLWCILFFSFFFTDISRLAKISRDSFLIKLSFLRQVFSRDISSFVTAQMSKHCACEEILPSFVFRAIPIHNEVFRLFIYHNADSLLILCELIEVRFRKLHSVDENLKLEALRNKK